MNTIPPNTLPKSPITDDDFRKLKEQQSQLPAMKDWLDRAEKSGAYPAEALQESRTKLVELETKLNGFIAAFQGLHPGV